MAGLRPPRPVAGLPGVRRSATAASAGRSRTRSWRRCGGGPRVRLPERGCASRRRTGQVEVRVPRPSRYGQGAVAPHARRGSVLRLPRPAGTVTPVVETAVASTPQAARGRRGAVGGRRPVAPAWRRACRSTAGATRGAVRGPTTGAAPRADSPSLSPHPGRETRPSPHGRASPAPGRAEARRPAPRPTSTGPDPRPPGAVSAPAAAAAHSAQVPKISTVCATFTIPVLRRDRLRPLLHRRALHLDRLAADPAHQVVVMVAGRAAPVDRLAVGRAQHIHLARVGEGLQGAVDRGQADRVAAVLEHVVQLLRAAELVHLVERRRHRGALPGRPASHWGRVLRRLAPSPQVPPRFARTSSSGHSARPASSDLDVVAGRRVPGTSAVHSAALASSARARRLASGVASAVSATKTADGQQHDRRAGRHVLVVGGGGSGQSHGDADHHGQRERRLERPEICCAAATGTTISALTSSSPTTRIATRDGDRRGDGDQQIQRAHRQPGHPRELLVLADGEQLPPQPQRDQHHEGGEQRDRGEVLRRRPWTASRRGTS